MTPSHSPLRVLRFNPLFCCRARSEYTYCDLDKATIFPYFKARGEMRVAATLLVVATLLAASGAVPGDSSQSALLAGRFDATADSTTCECTITAFTAQKLHKQLGQPPTHRCVIPPTATPQLLWRHHRDSTRVRIRIIMSHVHVRPGVNAEPIDYP